MTNEQKELLDSLTLKELCSYVMERNALVMNQALQQIAKSKKYPDGKAD